MSLIDQVEKLANLKGIVVLLCLIFLGVFVARNWDFVTDVTFHIAHPGEDQEERVTEGGEKEEEAGATIYANIERVRVCQMDFELPCYFLAEIRNTGRYDPTDLEVVVDFGRAGLRDFEVRPRFNLTLEVDSAGGVLRLTRRSLEPRQSLYIYALTSQPGFGSISVYTGGELRERLTYQDFQSQEDPESGGVPEKFVEFLWVLAGMIVVVMVIWGLIVGIHKLNEMVGVEWE